MTQKARGIDGLYAVTPDVADSAEPGYDDAAGTCQAERAGPISEQDSEFALRLEQSRLLAHLCRKFKYPSSSTIIRILPLKSAPTACI